MELFGALAVVSSHSVSKINFFTECLKNIQWANIFFSRQNNLLTSHIFFYFCTLPYINIWWILARKTKLNSKSFWVEYIFLWPCVCLFLIRNLSAIQDREICCYSISCKEKDNIGTTQTHTHAHKFKKTYVLCALALKLCSEQFCYFVETKQTHHYISMPNWSFWQKPKGQPAKHSVSVKLHKHVYVCLADNFCLWTQWNPWETLMRPQRQEVCSEHSADSRSLTLVSIKTRAMHA